MPYLIFSIEVSNTEIKATLSSNNDSILEYLKIISLASAFWTGMSAVIAFFYSFYSESHMLSFITNSLFQFSKGLEDTIDG